MLSSRRIFADNLHTPAAWMMMRAQTEILFSRWVTLTEHKWVIPRERRRLPYSPIDSPIEIFDSEIEKPTVQPVGF